MRHLVENISTEAILKSTSDNVQYRVRINTITPEKNRTILNQSKSCFIGISLENKNFQPHKLDAILKWATRQFTNCTLLIADSIHRINLLAVNNLQPEQALLDALHAGQTFIRNNQPVLDKYGPTNIRLLTCYEVQAWEDYPIYYDMVKKLFHENTNFRSSVESFSKMYHEKKSFGLTTDELSRRIQASIEYFLEEFAIVACLSRRGISTLIYPGSTGTFAEMADGLHPDVPDELKSLTAISLKLCRKK